MTYTANMELCKELYELSGWDSKALAEGWYWYADDSSFAPFVGERVLYDHTGKSVKATFIAPDYALGYLLRKLPPLTLNSGLNQSGTMMWDIYIHSGKLIGATGDTPENAACALAIELFKMGILEREE